MGLCCEYFPLYGRPLPPTQLSQHTETMAQPGPNSAKSKRRLEKCDSEHFKQIFACKVRLLFLIDGGFYFISIRAAFIFFSSKIVPGCLRTFRSVLIRPAVVYARARNVPIVPAVTSMTATKSKL